MTPSLPPELSLFGDAPPARPQFGNMETARAAKRRYATYLRPDTIAAIQRLAFTNRRKDYQVVQQALDDYLARRGGHAA